MKSTPFVSKTKLSSYIGKRKLNNELYYVHLKAAHEWGNSWNIIVDSVHESINNEMEKKYKPINQKLKKLEGTQTPFYEHQRNFYPRVVNKTNVTFTPDELTLLNKNRISLL